MRSTGSQKLQKTDQTIKVNTRDLKMVATKTNNPITASNLLRTNVATLNTTKDTTKTNNNGMSTTANHPNTIKIINRGTSRAKCHPRRLRQARDWMVSSTRQHDLWIRKTRARLGSSAASSRSKGHRSVGRIAARVLD